MIFNRDEARVHFELDRASKEQNKALFEVLNARAAEFDEAFGAPLLWRRMDDKKVSIVGYAKSFDGHNHDSWPAMIAWLVEHIQRMEKVFSPQIDLLRLALKQCQ
jgi:hypothetical protein